MPSDTLLLDQYIQSQDPQAFSAIVRRYSRMVFGTALRITRNRADAEDVSQETFHEFARRAGAGNKALPSYLHQIATHRALNLIRDAGRRRKREMERPGDSGGTPDPSWAELEPAIDKALAELPEDLRKYLIEHYLNGVDQGKIAASCGLNQSTISRKLQTGVLALREKLRKNGLTVSLAILGDALESIPSPAAPESLQQSLGKLALAGGPGRAPAHGWEGAESVMGLPVLVGIVAIILGSVAVVVYMLPVSTRIIPGTPSSVKAPLEKKGRAQSLSSKKEKPKSGMDSRQRTLTFDDFNAETEKCMGAAFRVAKRLGHQYIGTEHILYGLTKENAAVAGVFQGFQVSVTEIEASIRDVLKMDKRTDPNPTPKGPLNFTDRAKGVLAQGLKVANAGACESVEPAHLILGILMDDKSVALLVLEDLGIQRDALRKRIEESLSVGKMGQEQEQEDF